MIKLLVSVWMVFKPVHLMRDGEGTCGASERLMKENVRVNGTKVNYMTWTWTGENTLSYKAQPDAYMSTEIIFDGPDALWYTIRGIDAKRKPCMDTVYMKRVK